MEEQEPSPERSKAARRAQSARATQALIAQLAKINPAEEKALAEEWLTAEADWSDF